MSSANNSNFYTLSSFKTVKGALSSEGAIQAEKDTEQRKQTTLLKQKIAKCQDSIKYPADKFSGTAHLP